LAEKETILQKVGCLLTITPTNPNEITKHYIFDCLNIQNPAKLGWQVSCTANKDKKKSERERRADGEPWRYQLPTCLTAQTSNFTNTM
jgi:hypothetical protein